MKLFRLLGFCMLPLVVLGSCASPQNFNELTPLYLATIPKNPYRSSEIRYDATNRMLTCPSRDGVLGEGFGIVGF